MVIKTLRRTRMKLPSRWEGTLDDGRTVKIEYMANMLTLAVAGEKEQKKALPPELGRPASYIGDQHLVTLIRKHFPSVELPRG